MSTHFLRCIMILKLAFRVTKSRIIHILNRSVNMKSKSGRVIAITTRNVLTIHSIMRKSLNIFGKFSILIDVYCYYPPPRHCRLNKF